MTTDPQALERNVKGLILYQRKSHWQSGVRQAQEHLNNIHKRDVAIIADIKNKPDQSSAAILVITPLQLTTKVLILVQKPLKICVGHWYWMTFHSNLIMLLEINRIMWWLQFLFLAPPPQISNGASLRQLCTTNFSVKGIGQNKKKNRMECKMKNKKGRLWIK